MKIESIIQRAKGTVVEFPGVTYHFKPEQPGGPHVADVDNEDHADRLLSIPEGYRAAGKSKPAAPTVPVASEPSPDAHVLQGSDGAATAAAGDPAAAEARTTQEPTATTTQTEATQPPAEAPAKGKPGRKPKAAK